MGPLEPCGLRLPPVIQFRPRFISDDDGSTLVVVAGHLE